MSSLQKASHNEPSGRLASFSFKVYNLMVMTSQFHSLDGQPRRFALYGRGRTAEPNGHGYVSAWLILGVMSLIYLGWLGYRWLVQPAWPQVLPDLVAEFLRLVEVATALTLAILWAGLLWQRKGWTASGARPVLSVDQMYELSPKAFEHYVADLFRHRGYRVHIRGRSGDHGVDLELKSNGGRRAIVQCKRYRDTVGEEIVRGLFGTLLHERAHHAFLVTTAEVSDAARKWATGKPMTLIDGPTLVDIARAIDGARE